MSDRQALIAAWFSVFGIPILAVFIDGLLAKGLT